MTDVAYQIGEEIGSGAVATVYRVRDSAGQVYAGKVLHASHRRDPAATARFAQEAALPARLRHPNLVTVHGLVPIDDVPVLLLELVEGPSLAQVIARDAPLPAARAARLLAGIAAGLATAHEAGIIHRDLKPANVLIAPGDVAKISDFGMARATSFAGVASAFSVLGTPDYMAPECLDPLAVDARTDLYALGCILHEMLAGQPPYGGATPFAVLEQHRLAPVPPLPPETPPRLAALCAALLSKSPADRPQAAAAVLDSLAALQHPQALVPAAGAGGVGACARCGAALLADVPVCFGCGLTQARYAPGALTVVLTGPGAIADQLDAALRDRLLHWAERSPGLGLNPAPLRRRIPRLPFVLAADLSADAARSLCASMAALGFTAEIVERSARRLPAMRKKMRVLGGRTLAVAAASMGGVWGQFARAPLIFFGAVVAVGLGAFVIGAQRATRGVLTPLPDHAAPLPALLQQRVAALCSVVPALAEDRHRQALRGVVQRALQLRAALPPAEQGSLDEELAQALDQALVAAGRMDQIDLELGRALSAGGGDLNQADAELRERLLERDRWSGRLLDLAALLEGLRVRLAAARSVDGQALGEALQDLHVRVAALEEVSRL